jgi:hypothetical protein
LLSLPEETSSSSRELLLPPLCLLELSVKALLALTLSASAELSSSSSAAGAMNNAAVARMAVVAA